MKAGAREVESRLARPDPAIRAYLIYGPDRGLVRERADRLAAAVLEDPDDPFAISQLTDEDIKADPAALADAMTAMSLTGGARLVRLRISNESGGAPAAEFIKDLDAGKASAEAVLIIEAGDLTPRGKLRKTIEPSKTALSAPCYADDVRSLGELVDAALQEEGLRLDPDARAAWLPRLEGDRALARGEIEKMILFKGLRAQREGDDVIMPADIEAVAAGQGEAVLDAVTGPALEGLVPDADSAYARALSGGASPVGVLRALQRRLEQISALHAGGETAAMRTGAPRFGPAQAQFKRQSMIWAGKRLDKARDLAFQAERRVKRSGAPAEALVGELLLSLSRGAAQMRQR